MATPTRIERTSRLTSKGQVTIPLEVRRVLGVGPHDRVSFVVDGEGVHVRRTESVVDRTAGVLKSYFECNPMTPEQEKEFIAESWAQSARERMSD